MAYKSDDRTAPDVIVKLKTDLEQVTIQLAKQKLESDQQIALLTSKLSENCAAYEERLYSTERVLI